MQPPKKSQDAGANELGHDLPPLFFKKNIYLFIYFWPRQVLVAAHGIFRCCGRALCCGVRASL